MEMIGMLQRMMKMKGDGFIIVKGLQMFQHINVLRTCCERAQMMEIQHQAISS